MANPRPLRSNRGSARISVCKWKHNSSAPSKRSRGTVTSLANNSFPWNNLPILNEWKRLYPSQDPVKLHEQFWQTKLICPGGGHYVWNEKWQTMESSVYGHPGEPKAGPGKILPLANITGANFGLTFENQGLSAKAVLDRETAKR